MLTTPWAHDFTNAEGHPAHEPQAKRENGQGQVQGMVDLRPQEELLMPATGAVSPYFVFPHVMGVDERQERLQIPRQLRANAIF